MTSSLLDRVVELVKLSSKPLCETEIVNTLHCTLDELRTIQPSLFSNSNISCKQISVADAKIYYMTATNDDETKLRSQLIEIDQQQRKEIEMLLKQKSELEAKKNRHIKLLHDYNESKDVAQSIFGQLASIEGLTTKTVQLRFNVSLDD